MISTEAPSRERLKRYADLIMARGADVQPAQEVFLQVPLEARDFVYLVAESAYDLGAGHVTIDWTDDAFTRLEYERCPLERFETVYPWKREQMNGLSALGACNVMLVGNDPDALAGVDQAKVAAARKARNTQYDVWRHNLDFGVNAWTIAGVPTKAWARKVFPDLPEADAYNALWNAILDVSRVTEDPILSWDEHDAALKRSRDFMNENAFSELVYKSSNGTDFRVGLMPTGLWEGGSSDTVSGVRYFPNIPTEEVFTTPDRSTANGVVHSALPLVTSGRVVRDFWFRFEDGVIVDFGAAEGADVLEHLLATDEGARRLGECALISKNTPIRQTGILFYDTLYDENASCHLAIGMGFPECVEGGLDMSAEELLETGVNASATHVDFMIGADDLSITGMKPDGTEVPVFTDGQWAWE